MNLDPNTAANPGLSGGETARKAVFLPYLELFRAVAIVFVVLIHSSNALLQRGVVGALEGFSPVWTVFQIIAHGSTVYFALISGLLYSYYLHQRPHRTFMTRRLETVVLPYALLTIALTVLMAGLAANRAGAWPDAGGLLGVLGHNLLVGDAWNHLWYVPVITILYVVSPLLLKIASSDRWFPVAVVIALLPLVVSRTGTDITPNILVFFTGAYMAGILIGLDPERMLDRLGRQWPVWTGLAAISAVAIYLMDMQQIEYVGPVSFRETAFYVLRIALSILMLVALRAWSGRIGPRLRSVLTVIAVASFAIYLIHAPLLRPIVQLIGRFVPDGNPTGALVLAILASFALALALSTALVLLIRRVAGEWLAKRLIGS